MKTVQLKFLVHVLKYSKPCKYNDHPNEMAANATSDTTDARYMTITFLYFMQQADPLPVENKLGYITYFFKVSISCLTTCTIQ